MRMLRKVGAVWIAYNLNGGNTIYLCVHQENIIVNLGIFTEKVG